LNGSNSDSDGRLLGTLTVEVTEPQANHAGYCAAEGNTHPFTGKAISVGTFLDLVTSQPLADPHYKGATPAIYVQGKGITCDPPPAGYVRDGFAGQAQNISEGLYPYYRST